MEKKKSSHLTITIVTVIVMICLGLIILELFTNIQNSLAII